VTLIVDYNGDMFAYGKFIAAQGLERIVWIDIWRPLLVAVSIMTAWTLPFSAGLYALQGAARGTLAAVWVAITCIILGTNGSSIMKRLNIISQSSDYTVYTLLTVYSVFEFFLLKYVPGKRFAGPVTPMNNRPPYKDNGMACFIITLVTMAAMVVPVSPFYCFHASIIHKQFKEIIGACNVLALTLCILLTFKALFVPTNSDVRNDNNPIMAFYW
jgi:hypothetical protein